MPFPVQPAQTDPEDPWVGGLPDKGRCGRSGQSDPGTTWLSSASVPREAPSRRRQVVLTWEDRKASPRKRTPMGSQAEETAGARWWLENET